MKRRHISVLFLSFIIMICLGACNTQKKEVDIIVDNAFLLQEKEVDAIQNLSCLQLELNQSVDNIVALVQDSIIYYNYGEHDNSIIYFKFDMDTNTTHQIGIIENPNIHTGSTAQIDDKLYFYMNKLISNNDNSSETLETTLYEIDTANNTLKDVYSESVNQTLIYVDVMDEDILAFKGKTNEALGTTYIDTVSASDDTSVKADHSILISADYDNNTGIGEVIYNFSQSNGSVYTLNVEAEGMDNRTYIIKKYDSDGNHLKDIKLEKEIEDLLLGERISTFKVIGDYAFIRTFSSSGILCDISNDTAKAKLIGFEELDMAYSPANGKEGLHTILYNRNTGMAWVLDIEQECLKEIDMNYQSIEFITVDNQNNALISAGDMIYVDFMELPTKDIYQLRELTNALIN